MKYVISRRKSAEGLGALVVQLGSEDVVHADMVPKGYHPVGAGFCSMGGENGLTVDEGRKSESLNLGPHESDELLLGMFILGAFDQQRFTLEALYNDDKEDETELQEPTCCPNCGGTLVGDGFTRVVHCEQADVPLDVECDAAPVYCNGNKA